MELLSIIIALIFVASALQPVIQGRLLAARRANQIAAIEKERGSRVITMIHRQETQNLLGFRTSRMIDLEDAQQISQELRLSGRFARGELDDPRPDLTAQFVLAMVRASLLYGPVDAPHADVTLSKGLGSRHWAGAAIEMEVVIAESGPPEVITPTPGRLW